MANFLDLHIHIAGIGAGGSGCRVGQRLRKNWRYPAYLKAFGVTESLLQRDGDALIFRKISELLGSSKSVDRGVILALDGPVNGRGNPEPGEAEVYIPNEFVARETIRYDNLLFGASVNPCRRDALERLEGAAAQGAVLLKWIPAIQRFDPSSPALVPFYVRLKEIGIPLLVHTGAEHSFSRADHPLGDPQRLELPLEVGVTVIAAHVATTGHSGGQSHFDRLLRLFPRYSNLYADISSLTQLNKLTYLPKVLRHREIHDRLLYGTDFPLIQTPLVSPWYFPHFLGLKKMSEVAAIPNPWDRDVALKLALGFPPEIFNRGEGILRANKAVLS